MKSIIILAITALLSLVSAMEDMNGFKMLRMERNVEPVYKKFKVRGLYPGAPKFPSPGAPKSSSPGAPKGSPGPTKTGHGGCDNHDVEIHTDCGAGYMGNCLNGKPNCHLTNPGAACAAQGGLYMNTYKDKNGNECCLAGCHYGDPGCPEAANKASDSHHPCG
ncbi:uncharacterized protein MYCFIDRAFT_185898 [Pseudocercospora fijiensis CIRAD86]|uniref:Uncharacterized protein n=1 Tax=Pseudocercospora fijiensis (strain CIRAD86) TaxID=383855 RepID=N1QBW9_PSEFD|nr:uncharacterized protein MYCFIDRAFT_185898 [Pseudocercospora fijiensis CIRAD86]EME89701.1 hypothetical protein MYCFIDRAFT_185898 [Pseudocercospora fijiensis CIRAD86]